MQAAYPSSRTRSNADDTFGCGAGVRTHRLEALIDAQQALFTSLRRDDVLDMIALQSRRIAYADVSAVLLLDGENLTVTALSSECPVEVGVGDDILVIEAVAGLAFSFQQSQIVADVEIDPRVDAHAARRGSMRSLVAIPMRSWHCPVGVLVVGSGKVGSFDGETLYLLTLLLNAAGIALENAHKYQHVSETAVAAERARLARDLHDTVTQTLFSANLTAELLPRLWARDPEQGAARLQKLGELTRGALAEMRTLLIELRPKALVEMPLGDLMRQLADGIVGRAHIPVDVIVTGEIAPPCETRIAFYRIAQEALNNIAKHARAESAQVYLTQTDGQASLTIVDDGIGFDPSAKRAIQLGLQIMAERADAIGAVLTVDSAKGHGSRITAVWTGERQEKHSWEQVRLES